MPRREYIGDDACGLSRRWLLAPDVSSALVGLERWARGHLASGRVRWPGLVIISGYRSEALQAQVNPAAPQSLHTRCPALAADLRVGDVPASLTPLEIWTALGRQWTSQGLRWGGDFDPPDLNHFDAGGPSVAGGSGCVGTQIPGCPCGYEFLELTRGLCWYRRVDFDARMLQGAAARLVDSSKPPVPAVGP